MQRQLSQQQRLVQVRIFLGVLRGKQRDSDGKFKAGAFLFHIGGREVDGQLLHRPFVAGVDHRGTDTVTAFFHGNAGKTDDIKADHTLAQKSFYVDQEAVHALQTA